VTDKDDTKTMKTSEITARLQHASTAVTRAWIRDRGLEADRRDTDTGEKFYLRSEVEEAIESSVQRGPYRRSRPSADGPADDEHGALPPAGD
jgi:hypothetical protein